MSDPSAVFRLEPGALRCPYPHYEALRAEGPAVWVDELDAYVISSYDDATLLLRRTDVASSVRPTGPGLAGRVAEAVDTAERAGSLSELAREHLVAPHARTVFTLDPPDHTQMRRLISRILSPTKARQWEPLIRAEAESLAAALTADRAPDAPVDVVAEFARPFPERIIMALLRMPSAMVDELRRWTQALTCVIGNPAATDGDVMAMLEARAEMTRFFREHLRVAATAPDNDLVTALIEARGDDDRTLTESEQIGLLINLLVAGNETSIKAMSSAIRLLSERPDVWSILKADRTKVPAFVEEALRLEPPTQGMFRHLTQDVTIGDHTLPSGRDVYVNFAAANRDEVAFDDPERIDLERFNPLRHLAFGHGPHVCLGAWLARLELTIGIDALLGHVESIRLADGNTFDPLPSFLLHGLRRLDVHLDLAE